MLERFHFFKAPENMKGQAQTPQEKKQPEKQAAPHAEVVSLEQRRVARIKEDAVKKIEKHLGVAEKQESAELLKGIHEMCSDHYEELVDAVVERHLKDNSKENSLVGTLKRYVTKRPPAMDAIASRLLHIKDSVILSAIRAIASIPLEQKVQGKKVFESAVLRIMVNEIEKRLPQEVVHLDSSERSALYDLGWSDEQVKAQVDLLAGKNVVPLRPLQPKKEAPVATRIKIGKLVQGTHLSEAANDDRNIPPAA